MDGNAHMCRLCRQLHRIGFKTLAEHYSDLHSALATFYLDENDSICGCVSQDKTHVLCLLRWLRQTGDRPCPQCGIKFHSIHHITRHNSFNLLLRCYYDEWMLSLIWTHLWVGRMVWVTDWPWFLCLLVVPFVNILHQNLWHLFHLSRKTDFELIEFHYQWPQRVTEANHFFSSKIVAQHYVHQKNFEKPINYGALYDSCSFCGIEVYFKPHVRYVCHCYAYHLKCLNQVIQANQGRCSNCTKPLVYPNRFYLLLRSMPDLIFDQKWQVINMVWNYYPIVPWRREPSFFSYLLFTRQGFSQFILFVTALGFYVWSSPTSVKFAHALLAQLKVLFSKLGNHSISTLQSNSAFTDFYFIASIFWFCSEFFSFTRKSYLENSMIIIENFHD